MTGLAFKTSFSSPALRGVTEVSKTKENINKAFEGENEQKQKSFMDHLTEGVNNVNDAKKSADKMTSDIATGKNQNLHEAMLAMTQAELGFNFMVQVRNKALEAYQEISRMQV